MSDAHDHSHDTHDSHEHAGDHTHGHEHWGDYNSKPQPPSTLQPISPLWLSVFGVALAALLVAITAFSLRLAEKPQHADVGGHVEHTHSKSAH